MANVDRPFGARVAKTITSASYSAQLNRYEADDARSTTNGFGNIYAGDFVKREADGKVAPAVTGDTILGVAVGQGSTDDVNHGRSGPWNAPDLERRYLAADENGMVLVIDDPNVIIEIQEDADTDGAALTEADAGATRDITTTSGTSHGDTLSGESTVEIDSDGTTNGDLRLVSLVDRPDNAAGAHAKWLVTIANHYFG